MGVATASVYRNLLGVAWHEDMFTQSARVRRKIGFMMELLANPAYHSNAAYFINRYRVDNRLRVVLGSDG